MPKVHCQPLDDLVMQAKYAPVKQRRLQLDACEALVRLIDPQRSYPFEFVCFHLTGYRPRRSGPTPIIPGAELLQALPRYSAELSRSCVQPKAELVGRFLTVRKVADQHRVSEKTVKRWQKEGLVGRYIKSRDGKIRLVFRAATVRFFVTRHGRQVQQAQQFSQITALERQVILRRLAEWARRCPTQRNEALQRTARRFGRSLEAIRLLLNRHEDELGMFCRPRLGLIADQVQFHKRAEALDDAQRAEMLRLFEEGTSVDTLAEQYQRSRSNVYRMIMFERARQFKDRAIDLIPSEQFEAATGRRRDWLHAPVGLFDGTEGLNLTKPLPADATADTYQREISGVAVLGAEQEAFLFRKYNYLKFLATQSQRQLDLSCPVSRLIKQGQAYLAAAEKVRALLIRSNLRLVVSIARKHTKDDAEMMELLSEGNYALMNAVEKFDFARGHKFSTYASWVIMRCFAAHQRKSERDLPAASNSEIVADVVVDHRRPVARIPGLEAARQRLEAAMQDLLVERERFVLREVFGFVEHGHVGPARPKSLQQIGQVLGVSKERIRQIKAAALEKLRTVITPESMEVVLGR